LWNAERRFQGQIDVDLDEVGRAQAAHAARLLARLAPSAIVASDLARARATAEALATLVGLPVTIDKRLREINVGWWEGLTLDEVAARDPASASEWRDGGEGRRGGGESLVEVGERISAAIAEFLPTLAADATLVVATHGAAGRALVASMIGLPTTSWRSLSSLANCCWSVVTESAHGWRLYEHNSGSLPEPIVGDDR